VEMIKARITARISFSHFATALSSMICLISRCFPQVSSSENQLEGVSLRHGCVCVFPAHSIPINYHSLGSTHLIQLSFNVMRISRGRGAKASLHCCFGRDRPNEIKGEAWCSRSRHYIDLVQTTWHPRRVAKSNINKPLNYSLSSPLVPYILDDASTPVNKSSELGSCTVRITRSIRGIISLGSQ